MWSDNESKTDLFQADHLATGVAEIIGTPELLPTTIGLFGDWGSGKSTTLGLVRKKVEALPGTMTVDFAGWLFEGYDDAKSALMGSILDEIEKRVEEDKGLLEKAGDLVKKLMRRVDLLHAAGLAAKVAVPTMIGLPHLGIAAAIHDLADKAKDVKPDELKKVLKDAKPEEPKEIRRNIREFRKEFGELLAKCEIKTLVVLIDDLDRCLPETVISILEAIKLFLFVPGTAFVLAADERLVQYAVRRRFPEFPGEINAVGRDYLEKLVQNPVRIPALGVAETEAYIGLMFAEKNLSPADFASVCDRVTGFVPNERSPVSFDLGKARELFGERLSKDLEGDLDLTAQIGPILGPGLEGNPRRIKRFLNTLVFRLGQAGRRGLTLRRDVLVKLMLLEYLKSEFFRQLASIQGDDSGRSAGLGQLEAALRTQGKPQEPEGDRTAGGKAASVPKELEAWVSDDWIKKWANLDPALGEVDLRPYFYVAHDQVGPVYQERQRLSPRAAEALLRLTSRESVSKGLALKEIPELGQADATGMFEALARQVRQSVDEELGDAYDAMFDFTGARGDEFKPQLVVLLQSISHSRVPAKTVARFLEVLRTGSAAAAARALLATWVASPEATLANAARLVAVRWDAAPKAKVS